MWAAEGRPGGPTAHQWFLTWLSVRPGSSLAISDHLLPSSLCALAMICSSSSVHSCTVVVVVVVVEG